MSIKPVGRDATTFGGQIYIFDNIDQKVKFECISASSISIYLGLDEETYINHAHGAKHNRFETANLHIY